MMRVCWPRSALPAMLVVLAVLAAPAPLRAQERNPETLFERASGSRMKGPPAARVLVYEIADFQCPYCADFARNVYPQIDSAYIRTGKVQWVFVGLPLPNHAHSWLATEAALCAGAVGNRFWAMHDRLFADQAEWTGATTPATVFARYAREAGVPMAGYEACVAEDRVASVILADVIFAASTRVSGTPMFIINNEQTVVGVKNYTEWKELLDRLLSKK